MTPFEPAERVVVAYVPITKFSTLYVAEARGLFDKYYGAGFDTMYVLTDGAPSWGDVLEPEEIRRLVRETNALRKITIHCVTFGDKNATDFLRLLAEENGGRHIHIE